MKQICVVGVGYVGLISAAGFADLGNRVIALDISEEKIDGLKRGEMPIYEPGLEEILKQNDMIIVLGEPEKIDKLRNLLNE